MKKFIILALFFVFVLNEEQDDDDGPMKPTYTGKNLEKCLNHEAPSEKNCNDIDLENNYGCCYLTGKDENGNYKRCFPLSESEKNGLLASYEEEKEDDEEFSLKCPDFSSSSNYLSKALIIILSLLF